MKRTNGLVAVMVMLAFLGAVGWFAYGYFATGYHTAPRDRPDGSRLMIFAEDRRAVILPEVSVSNSERRYQLLPRTDAPEYLIRSWYICRRPTDSEVTGITASIERPGSRFDAICEIESEGTVFQMGFIYSVPR